MFDSITTWEGRRILKLRIRLWWRFKPFWYDCPYRVAVWFRRRSAPWPHYYTFVSLISGQKPLEIGPVDTWTVDEAIAMARAQWLSGQESQECQEMSGKVHGSALVPPLPTIQVHSYSVNLEHEANYSLLCSCGWKSAPTPRGHHCQADNCAECRRIYDSWGAHIQEVVSK